MLRFYSLGGHHTAMEAAEFFITRVMETANQRLTSQFGIGNSQWDVSVYDKKMTAVTSVALTRHECTVTTSQEWVLQAGCGLSSTNAARGEPRCESCTLRGICYQ